MTGKGEICRNGGRAYGARQILVVRLVPMKPVGPSARLRAGEPRGLLPLLEVPRG